MIFFVMISIILLFSIQCSSKIRMLKRLRYLFYLFSVFIFSTTFYICSIPSRIHVETLRSPDCADISFSTYQKTQTNLHIKLNGHQHASAISSSHRDFMNSIITSSIQIWFTSIIHDIHTRTNSRNIHRYL
ncbi:hypothetical protein BDV32DRAFT_9408 [Aspergillus pseudonomiae]|nr:hypothetical protein BDV32DRAFT_9408 [Aspergillus pseudonomiae]